MAIGTISTLDLIRLPGPVDLTQISQQQWNTAAEILTERAAAHTHPMFRGVMNQQPQITFSTSMLGTLLASCPLVGASIASTLYTYFKKAAVTGSVARATSQHSRVAMTLGYLHWNSITLNHNQPSEADCVLTAAYDGTNEPFVAAGSVALSGNLTDTEHFVCGPVYINGSQISSIKQAVISSGIQLRIEGADGEPWPTFVGLEMTDPVVTIQTTEVSPFVSAGVDGLALNGSSGLVVYGRKMTKNQAGGVTRVANGTSQHLSFTGLNGMWRVDMVDANGTSPAMATIRVELTSPDDSTLPLIVATTATIP